MSPFRPQATRTGRPTAITSETSQTSNATEIISIRITPANLYDGRRAARNALWRHPGARVCLDKALNENEIILHILPQERSSEPSYSGLPTSVQNIARIFVHSHAAEQKDEGFLEQYLQQAHNVQQPATAVQGEIWTSINENSGLLSLLLPGAEAYTAFRVKLPWSFWHLRDPLSGPLEEMPFPQSLYVHTLTHDHLLATLYLEEWKEERLPEGLESMFDSDFGLSLIPSTARQFAHDVNISMMLYHARWCISAIEGRLREIRFRSMSDGRDAVADTLADLEENVALMLEVATTIFGQSPGSWMTSQFPFNDPLAVREEHHYTRAIFIVNAQHLLLKYDRLVFHFIKRFRSDRKSRHKSLLEEESLILRQFSTIASFYLPLSLAAGILNMQARFSQLGLMFVDFFCLAAIISVFTWLTWRLQLSLKHVFERKHLYHHQQKMRKYKIVWRSGKILWMVSLLPASFLAMYDHPLIGGLCMAGTSVILGACSCYVVPLVATWDIRSGADFRIQRMFRSIENFAQKRWQKSLTQEFARANGSISSAPSESLLESAKVKLDAPQLERHPVAIDGVETSTARDEAPAGARASVDDNHVPGSDGEMV